MIKFNDLRSFLEKNKIFFEIIIPIAVIYIAFKANQIAEYQINLDKINSQPHFEVQLKKNGEFNHLIVKHISGKYQNLLCSMSSTLVFLYPNLNGAGTTIKEVYVIEGNIFPFLPTLSEKKPILIKNLDSLLYSTRKKFEQYSKKKFPSFYTDIALKTYLKIEYLDFENDLQTKYFNVSTEIGYQINDELGSRIFDFTSHSYLVLKEINEDKIEAIVEGIYPNCELKNQ